MAFQPLKFVLLHIILCRARKVAYSKLSFQKTSSSFLFLGLCISFSFGWMLSPHSLPSSICHFGECLSSFKAHFHPVSSVKLPWLTCNLNVVSSGLVLNHSTCHPHYGGLVTTISFMALSSLAHSHLLRAKWAKHRILFPFRFPLE